MSATMLVAVVVAVVTLLVPELSSASNVLQEEENLLAILKRLSSELDNNKDTSTSSDDPDVDAELIWEHAQMYIINGTSERHVDDYKPWLNIPPEYANGASDEILTHEDKVLMNLESETDSNSNENDNRGKRKFLYAKGDSKLWPLGIIPYRFATDQRRFRNSDTYNAILNTMKWYDENTCIKWREATPQNQNRVGHGNYVEIGTGSGCSSNVGRVGQDQKTVMTLQESHCINFRTISHEMGHALGLHHEHVRSDRDEHVDVIWSRLSEKPGGTNWGKADTFNYAPYDLGSNMHYNLYAGSREQGKMAIVPKNMELDFLASTRQPTAMSFYDLQAIHFVYDCAKQCNPKPVCLNGGFVDKSCKCVCPSTLTGPQCEDIDTDSTTCGGVLDVDIGDQVEISSPGFPGNYPQGSNCGWLIRGPQLATISLDITALDIPTVRGFNRYTGDHEELCAHHLEVRYNLIGQPGPRFCGQDWQRDPLITTMDGQPNFMIVRFNSTKSGSTGTGFRATVKVSSVGCRSDPCQNGGTCRDRKVGPSCKCPMGFTGPFCEKIGSLTILCDFENQTGCHFLNDMAAPQKWKLLEGGTPSSGTGPTTGFGGSGQYAYLETSFIPNGDKARLMSSLLKPAARCVNFKYHMYGSTMGSLAVKVLEDGEERVEFQVSGDQGTEWRSHQMTVRGSKAYRIIFEAVRGSNYKSDIALDNVEVKMKKCKGDKKPTKAPPTDSACSSQPCQNNGKCSEDSGSSGYKCKCRKNFSGTNCEMIGTGNYVCFFGRSNKCPFTIDQTTAMRWEKKTGPTNTADTGPSTGKGGQGPYLYVNAKKYSPGQTAAFTSSLLDNSPRCLKFNYHMYGSTMGKLEVKLVSAAAGEKTAFEVSGNRGNKWRKLKMDVSSNGPYKVKIVATRGSGIESDIAIDSLKLSYWRCGETPPTNQNSPASFIPDTPIITRDIDQITCKFDEQNLCKFAQTQKDDLDWTVKHGPLPTQGTGPLGDHTGKGYYLALEGSDTLVQGQKGALVSDILTFGSVNEVCLCFWYHIEGDVPANLLVRKLWTENSNIDQIELWKSDGSVSQHWRQAKVTMVTPEYFRIIIEGTLNERQNGIGLDDVTIEKGPCNL